MFETLKRMVLYTNKENGETVYNHLYESMVHDGERQLYRVSGNGDAKGVYESFLEAQGKIEEFKQRIEKDKDFELVMDRRYNE